MDEKAKPMFYRQLQEMSELNQKENAASLISEQEFLALSDKEALKYTFEYRDKETDFGEAIYYLEMPDMDFQGQDLSDVSISRFMLSRVEDGKRVPSKINVNGTRIAINLNGIGISEQSQDELGISDQVIDFSNVDFRGCEIRGILPDEYTEETKAKTRGKITVTGRENLDERYLQRRKEHHLTPEAKAVTDRAYARLLSGGTLYRTKSQKQIDFTDYDLELTSVQEIDVLHSPAVLDIHQLAAYLEAHWEIAPSERIEEEIIERTRQVSIAYETGDMSLVRQYFYKISEDLRVRITKSECEKGNYELIDMDWYFSTHPFDKGTILKSACEKGHYEFVDKYFDEFTYGQDDLAIIAFRNGNDKYIKKVMEESTRGPWLAEELRLKGVNLGDTKLVLKLIELGADVNYEKTTYYGDDLEKKEPSLYRALKIEDEVSRRQIVEAMLRAGVNPNSIYSYQIYEKGKKITKKESCLDINNGELRQIMSELGMEVPQEKGSIAAPKKTETRQVEPKQDNRVLVSDFLTHEVGLSEEEIKKLETTYRGWGRDLYSLSTERLGMQKVILDSVDGTKRAFTTDVKVLNNDPQILYSRLMFYRESGITVMPDRLCTTLGISKKGFAKNFGGRVLEQGNMEEADYEYKLKQELLKRYPMPETRDELKRTLEELNKEEIGG